MTTQLRARKGGETGVNGLQYQGGAFLPTTQLGKMAKGEQKSAKIGKREVAPYQWEVQPYAGAKSIWSQTMGVGAEYVDGKLQPVARVYPGGVAWNGQRIEEMQALCNRWNAGERWL